MKSQDAPTTDSLHEAALAYLARRPAAVVQLRRVLSRRIDAWARRAGRGGVDEAEIAASSARANDAADAVIARLRANGLLDDVVFASHRARRLVRAGKSRRAISADLAHKGVATETAREAVAEDPDSELTAAVTFARKRRIGAFAREEGGDKKRWLAAMARAGYSFSTAERVLRMDRESAEELLRGAAPSGW